MKRYRIRCTAIMLVLVGLLQLGIIPMQTVNAATSTNKKDTLKIVELDKNWNAIGQYSEGLCPVQDKTSGMWGYVDKTGKYIIKPEYYEAMPFSEGLAAVKNSSGLYNFINKTGKIIVTGKFTKVLPRFRGELAGYKNGLAVVSLGDINKRSKYTLIDKKGNELKELDENTSYVIDMGRFENKGSIVTNSDRTNFIYDIQYNKIAEFEGGYSHRLLYNYSTKYLIFDDTNINNVSEGTGFFIGAADGIKVFEQKKIAGIDNSYSYKMGITDDYVIIQRNLNGINTSAAYDFKGKIVIDYKYKEIIPINKDLFIVKNNADTFGIIDSKNKELLPFSMGLRVLSRANQREVIYEKAQKLGAVDFIIKDKQGKEKAKYFDFKTKKINDYFMMDYNGWNINAYEFRCNTQSGLIHLSDSNYSATIYNSLGAKIGNIIYFFSPGYFGKTITKKEPFIYAGIIPVLRKDKLGYTFAVIKK